MVVRAAQMGLRRKQRDELNRKAGLASLERERAHQKLAEEEELRHAEMVANVNRLRELRLARDAAEREAKPKKGART
jgi:hypothetical protein